MPASRSPVLFCQCSSFRHCDGIDGQLRFVDPVVVTQKVIEGFFPGISTAEVDVLAAETCAYMSQKHPDFSVLAARIAISNLHKNTSDSFYETCKAHCRPNPAAR